MMAPPRASAAARYPAEARSRGRTTVPAISLNTEIEKYIGYCILRERGGDQVEPT
jgi:hypothetical protein